MRIARRVGMLLVALTFIGSRADAALLTYTDQSSFDAAAGSGLSLATFDSLSGNNYQTLSNSVSSAIPTGVTFSSTGGGSSDLFVAPTNFGGDTQIASPSLFANFFGTPLIATFSPGVTAVGSNLLSFPTGVPVTVTVTNADSTTASFVITPAAYLGLIATGGTSISSISYQPPAGFTAGVDNYEFGTAAPVPEPATLALFGFGLAGMGTRRWRQRKASR